MPKITPTTRLSYANATTILNSALRANEALRKAYNTAKRFDAILVREEFLLAVQAYTDAKATAEDFRNGLPAFVASVYGNAASYEANRTLDSLGV